MAPTKNSRVNPKVKAADKMAKAKEAAAKIAADNGGAMPPNVKTALDVLCHQLQQDTSGEQSENESASDEDCGYTHFESVKEVKSEFHVKKKGSHYSEVEDLLICKAFIAATTDGLISTYRKREHFVSDMYSAFQTLVKDHQQNERVNMLKESAKDSTGEIAVAGVKVFFPERDADSIYKRFMNTTSKRVSKFVALQQHFDKKSGEDYKKWQDRVMSVYKKRFGHCFKRFYACKEYLANQPKWRELVKPAQDDKENDAPPTSILKKQNKTTRTQKERGGHKGFKRLKQQQEEDDVIDRVLFKYDEKKKLSNEKDQDKDSYQKKLFGFLDTVSSHMAAQSMDKWSEEQRAEYYAAQQSLAVAQLRRQAAENEQAARTLERTLERNHSNKEIAVAAPDESSDDDDDSIIVTEL